MPPGLMRYSCDKPTTHPAAPTAKRDRGVSTRRLHVPVVVLPDCLSVIVCHANRASLILSGRLSLSSLHFESCMCLSHSLIPAFPDRRSNLIVAIMCCSLTSDDRSNDVYSNAVPHVERRVLEHDGQERHGKFQCLMSLSKRQF